jgi:hypothetical protein
VFAIQVKIFPLPDALHLLIVKMAAR